MPHSQSLTPNQDKVRAKFANTALASTASERIVDRVMTALSEAVAYEADVGSESDVIFSGYLSSAASMLLSASLTVEGGDQIKATIRARWILGQVVERLKNAPPDHAENTFAIETARSRQ